MIVPPGSTTENIKIVGKMDTINIFRVGRIDGLMIVHLTVLPSQSNHDKLLGCSTRSL